MRLLILSIFISLLIIDTKGTLGQSTINKSMSNVLWSAQNEKGNRLFPGDFLPAIDQPFTDTKNFNSATFRWTDLKSKKLIILDIWSKYCSSCIAAFPKMESLQNEYDDQIQIILVTANSREELANLFQNSPKVRNSKLPMIFSDSIFTKKYFPHSAVPYHIWIGSDNKVIATTAGNSTNSKNINAVLKGLPNEIEILHPHSDKPNPIEMGDPHKSIFEFDGGRLLNNLIYYSQISSGRESNEADVRFPVKSGKVTTTNAYSALFRDDPGYIGVGIGNITTRKDNDDKKVGLRMYNVRLFDIFGWGYSLASATPMLSDFYYYDSSILSTPTLNVYSGSTPSELMETVFSYESHIDDYDDKKAGLTLLQDLYKYFGLKIKVENKLMTYLVFTISDSTKLKHNWAGISDSTLPTTLRDSTGLQYMNCSWGSFCADISFENNYGYSALIVIDSTGIGFRKMNFALKGATLSISDDENFHRLQNELLKIGISLHKHRKEFPVNYIYRD